MGLGAASIGANVYAFSLAKSVAAFVHSCLAQHASSPPSPPPQPTTNEHYDATDREQFLPLTAAARQREQPADEIEGSGSDNYETTTRVMRIDGVAGRDNDDRDENAVVNSRVPTQIASWRRAAAALLARRSRDETKTTISSPAVECAVDIGKTMGSSRRSYSSICSDRRRHVAKRGRRVSRAAKRGGSPHFAFSW